MPEGINVFVENVANQQKANEVIGRLFEVAQPEQAFSPPVTQGEYTVITAAEVSVSMGLGYGSGGGTSRETEEKEEEKESGYGYGGGGGGGGVAIARPIAAIEVGPRGIVVEPIVDVTKIALAFITALGTMAMMVARMSKDDQ